MTRTDSKKFSAHLDGMNGLETVALFSVVSGTVFQVFLFGIGVHLKDITYTAGDVLEVLPQNILYYLRVIFGALQAVGFDLVVVATVNEMRKGRRSKWSWATAIASAIVSALIALDVASVMDQPWMHASYAIIVLAFTMHLFTEGKSVKRSKQLRGLVRRLIATLRRERETIAALQTQLQQERERVLAWQLATPPMQNRHSVVSAKEKNDVAVASIPVGEDVWQAPYSLPQRIRALIEAGVNTKDRVIEIIEDEHGRAGAQVTRNAIGTAFKRVVEA